MPPLPGGSYRGRKHRSKSAQQCSIRIGGSAALKVHLQRRRGTEGEHTPHLLGSSTSVFGKYPVLGESFILFKNYYAVFFLIKENPLVAFYLSHAG